MVLTRNNIIISFLSNNKYWYPIDKLIGRFRDYDLYFIDLIILLIKIASLPHEQQIEQLIPPPPPLEHF